MRVQAVVFEFLSSDSQVMVSCHDNGVVVEKIGDETLLEITAEEAMELASALIECAHELERERKTAEA